MTGPIALALLFLMAVAPALPWRRASGELLRDRLQVPAWLGALTLAVCVAFGVRGLTPLLAFGLGAFAAAAAVRQLVLSTRREGWRGFFGRSNGGMVVHLGIVVIAVAFAASSAYSHRAEVRLQPGQSRQVHGHRVTFLGTVEREYANRTALIARVQVDGDRVYRPALSKFPFASQSIGTPSVHTSARQDVYLTLLASPRESDGSVLIGVLIRPLVVWLWVGGAIVALGTLMAAVPTRRRVPPAEPEPEPEPALAVPA